MTLNIADEGIPSRTSQQDVVIYLEDINDNRPYFLKPKYEFQFLMINDAWTVEVEDADSRLIAQFRIDYEKHPELSLAIEFIHFGPQIVFKNPSAIQPGIYSFTLYVKDESLSLEEYSTILVLKYESDPTISTTLSTTNVRIILGVGFAVLLIIIISITLIIIILIIYAVRRRSGVNAYHVHRRNPHHNGTSSILKLNHKGQDSINSKKVSFNSKVHLMTFSLPDGSTSESTSASSNDITNEERSRRELLQWPISSKHDAQNITTNPGVGMLFSFVFQIFLYF